MAATLQIITELSNYTAVKLTNRPAVWTEFLRTAAWNYKYAFPEQVLIYAQKPTATACAPIELWNERFGRRVKRGSRGIALIDDAGSKLRLRYVFDVSDTVSQGSRKVPIWKMEDQYQDAVTEALEAGVGELESKDSLAEAIISAADCAAEDNMTDYLAELFTIRNGSFLEELDDFNVAVSLKKAIRVSVAFITLTRCGMDAEKFFEADDFVSVLDFNTLPTISLLGGAVSDISEMVLREIDNTIRHQRVQEIHKIAKSAKIEHNTLKAYTERGDEHGDDILNAGRLPSARPDSTGAADHREIWDAAQIIPQKSPESDVHQPASFREPDGASRGDRPYSTRTRGADDGADGRDGGRERDDEGRRPDEVDRADEQPEALGGGVDFGRADLQLEKHERRTEDNSLPFFHTEPVLPTEPTRDNSEYVLTLGATVYIGTDAFEILSYDTNRVVLFDPAFPLFNKEITRADFERKLRENPLNDHLIVKHGANNALDEADVVVEIPAISDIAQEAAPPLAELSEDDFAAYNAIKERDPEYLVAFRAGDYFEFYGDDAKTARGILNSNILRRDIPGAGTVDMTGFRADEWVFGSHRLWRAGQNVALYELDEDGGRRIVKRLSATDYIPLGMELTIDDRHFVVESVDFTRDKVSLRDVTFAGATGFPIFRAESVDFVRSYVEEQRAEPSLKELLTIPNELEKSQEQEPQSLEPTWEKHHNKTTSAHMPEASLTERLNYRITDDNLCMVIITN